MRTLWALLTAAALASSQETARPRHNASYVPDDKGPVRALVANATEAAQSGRLDEAVRALQALLREEDAGVVAVRGRELFVSARRWAALQLLSERDPFGPPVLAAWRKVHGPSATAAILAALRAGAEAGVLELVSRYPAVDAAPTALLALSDRALQRGDKDIAYGYLLRAAEHVPVSAKAAWLESPAYQTRRQHLETGTTRRPGHWPTLGGDATRARNGDPLPDVAGLKRVWEALLLENGPPFAFTNDLQSETREHSPILPFYPVFDDQHMYVHMGGFVRVFARATGKLLYLIPPVDGPAVERRWVDEMIQVSPGVRAATVAGDVLYFNRLHYNMRGEPLRHNALVAFDTKRRTTLWEVQHGPGPRPDALRKFIFFRGAPAVERGRLYVYGAVREQSEGKPSRKEEAYLYCFEAATGQLLWHRFLGYGDTEAAAELPPQSGMAPAVRHGVVVVTSGLGVAAALDARTGEFLWLLRYDRKPIRERQRLTEWNEKKVHLGSGWLREAPRIDGGRVFLQPMDSDQRYGCWLRGIQDPADGQFYVQQWAVARNANPGKNSLLEQLAGVAGGRAYYIGRRDELAGAAETYQTVVSTPVGRGEDGFAYGRIPPLERGPGGLRIPPEVFGRATIAGTALLVPTQRILFRFDAARAPSEKLDGPERFREVEPLPHFAPDPPEPMPGESPAPLFGTLVSLGGRLYAATADRVICYAADVR